MTGWTLSSASVSSPVALRLNVSVEEADSAMAPSADTQWKGPTSEQPSAAHDDEAARAVVERVRASTRLLRVDIQILA